MLGVIRASEYLSESQAPADLMLPAPILQHFHFCYPPSLAPLALLFPLAGSARLEAVNNYIVLQEQLLF